MENPIKYAILTLFLLLPGTVLAATECNYVEFPDHFEAVCAGDEKFAPSTPSPASVPGGRQSSPGARGDAPSVSPAGGAQATGVDKKGPGHPAAAALSKGRKVYTMSSNRGNLITREMVDSKLAIRMQSIQFKK